MVDICCKRKKIDLPHPRRSPKKDINLKSGGQLGYSVADLLNDVKNEFKRTLQISKDSCTHGISGARSAFALRTNARLSSIIGEICQNAIPINGLANTHNVKGTYTMVSLIQTKVRENSEWLVARVTIEQQNGKVLGVEALDVTHAISGIFTSIKDEDITKIAESSASQGPHSGDYVERAHKLSANISIEDLLKIVNRTHQEFLSDDVIKRLGKEAYLKITKTNDGRNILYAVKVNVKKGTPVDKGATSRLNKPTVAVLAGIPSVKWYHKTILLSTLLRQILLKTPRQMKTTVVPNASTTAKVTGRSLPEHLKVYPKHHLGCKVTYCQFHKW